VLGNGWLTTNPTGRRSQGSDAGSAARSERAAHLDTSTDDLDRSTVGGASRLEPVRRSKATNGGRGDRGPSVELAGPPRTIFRRAIEHNNLVLADVTAREIGRVTIAEALEPTTLFARKPPERYGRFAARWLCLYLEEHEKATLERVELLLSNLQSLASPKNHASALAILRKPSRRG
jgi:hypothetical protein